VCPRFSCSGARSACRSGTYGAAYRHAPPGLRSRLRSLDWLDGTEGRTKAEDHDPSNGREPVTVPRPAARGVEAPTAAPEHPVRACILVRFHFRVASTRQLVRVNIAAPLPNVAVRRYIEREPVVAAHDLAEPRTAPGWRGLPSPWFARLTRLPDKRSA
jgi:hypothetical protein